MISTDYKEIIDHLWHSFSTIRGLVDTNDAQSYILGLLALKKMSDIDEDEVADWSRIKSMSYDIGLALNDTIRNIERKRPELDGWFDGLDYESNSLGDRQIRDKLLGDVVSDISAIDLKTLEKKNSRGLSDLCIQLNEMFLIKSSRGDLLETPSTIIHLMVKLLETGTGCTVYDPFCKSGITLIAAAASASTKNEDKKIELFGQTNSPRSALIAHLNFLLTGHRDARIFVGDVIRQPGFASGKSLTMFQKILTTIAPMRCWRDEIARYDPYSRFVYGLPPKTMGDFGFLQHCIASLADEGMLVVAVPPSVLFKERSEGDIRRRMVLDDIIEAVIQLPPKMYTPYTNISFALLVIRRNKPSIRKNKILFINAKDGFLPGRSRNILRNEDLDEIVGAYREFRDRDGYCSVESLDCIANKDFHLDVSEYVIEKPFWEMDLDLEASINELDEIRNTTTALYEGMQSNLKRVIKYNEIIIK